jgi:hypothetical protein
MASKTQTIGRNQVTTRRVFHFKDGSQDETTVFAQHPHSKLVSDHMIQKGPPSKQSVDLSVTSDSGEISGKSTDSRRKRKSDFAPSGPSWGSHKRNRSGVLKNLRSDTTNITVPLVTPSSKPRLVKLEMSPRATGRYVRVDTRRRRTTICPLGRATYQGGPVWQPRRPV